MPDYSRKKFSIKIYDSAGSSLLKTVNPRTVKAPPTFSSKLNGGFGQCEIDLSLPFDDFDEGVSIDFMNIVEINEIDSENASGRLIYKGFISSYTAYTSGASQGVKLRCLGLVSLLSFAFYKTGGGSFTVAHSLEDPSVTMKAIIDHFNTVYSGSLLGYDGSGTTVDTVGTNIDYTFEKKKWSEALKDIFKTVGAGWWWVIDKNGQLYLKQKPASATHNFTIGKDVESFSVLKDSESVVNAVRVEGSGGGTSDDSDATSQSNFGKREKYITDTQAGDATTRAQIADQFVNDNKDEKVKASLVINLNYDLESIKVGDTCQVLNIKQGDTLFNNNMFIVGIKYSWDKVVLELEDFSANFGEEIDKFVNS